MSHGRGETAHRELAVTGLALMPLNWVTDGIKDALAGIIKMLLGTVLRFMLGLIEELLFFPSPENLALNDNAATVAFVSILVVGWLVTLLSIQVFPGSAKADPYRLLERTFIGIILVLASDQLFDFAIRFTNAVGLFFFPTASEIMDPLVAEFETIVATGIGLVAIYYVVGGLLLLAVASFVGTLLLRVFIVYTLYVLFPLFVAFWIFDFGIGKHTKKFADMFFKAGAMTLVVGIVIAAVLSAGVVIADPQLEDGDAVSQFSQSPNGTESGSSGDSVGNSETCLLPGDKSAEADGCIVAWSSLLVYIGLGGAMVVSTSVSMMGISSVTSGGGAVTGAISGAVAGTIAGGGGGGGSSGNQEPEPGGGGGEPGGGAGSSGGGGPEGGGDSGVGGGAARTTTQFQPSTEQSSSAGMSGKKLNQQPPSSGGTQAPSDDGNASNEEGSLTGDAAAAVREKAFTGGGKALGTAAGEAMGGSVGGKVGSKLGEMAGGAANNMYEDSAVQTAVHEKAGQLRDSAGEKINELRSGNGDGDELRSGGSQDKAGHSDHEMV